MHLFTVIQSQIITDMAMLIVTEPFLFISLRMGIETVMRMLLNLLLLPKLVNVGQDVEKPVFAGL